jgi:hypothetical protein
MMPASRSPLHPFVSPALGQRVQAVACAAAMLLVAGAAAAGDAAPDAAHAGRATVGTIVAGIVSYTRWPGQTKSVRLCTVGGGRGVEELLAIADPASMQPGVAVRAAASAAVASGECDVVYVGAVASGASRELLRSTQGRPVLMIGEGQEFCSDGGMFCLQPGAATVSFTVNLDAIARSGLRVNPWVLRIARNAPGGGS